MLLPMILAQVEDGGINVLAGGAVMFLIWIVLVVAAIGLFIWALVDAIKNPNLGDTERIVWILVIVFVGCLGPILYLLIGRNKTPGSGAGPSGRSDEPAV